MFHQNGVSSMAATSGSSSVRFRRKRIALRRSKAAHLTTPMSQKQLRLRLGDQKGHQSASRQKTFPAPSMPTPPKRSAERGPGYARATRDPGSASAVRDDTVKKVFIWKALVQAVPAPKAKLTCWWAIWRDQSPDHARGSGWVTRMGTKALLEHFPFNMHHSRS